MALPRACGARTSPPAPILQSRPFISSHLTSSGTLSRRAISRSYKHPQSLLCRCSSSSSSSSSSSAATDGCSDWDWNRWSRHFSETDQAENFSSVLKVTILLEFHFFDLWLLGVWFRFVDFSWIFFSFDSFRNLWRNPCISKKFCFCYFCYFCFFLNLSVSTWRCNWERGFFGSC